MESVIDKLTVPTNVLDVSIDLVRTKSGEGQQPPYPPPLGNANELDPMFVSLLNEFLSFIIRQKIYFLR